VCFEILLEILQVFKFQHTFLELRFGNRKILFRSAKTREIYFAFWRILNFVKTNIIKILNTSPIGRIPLTFFEKATKFGGNCSDFCIFENSTVDQVAT
jgi:hypothetical protein